MRFIRGLGGLLTFAVVMTAAVAPPTLFPAHAQSEEQARVEYELRQLGAWAQSVNAFNMRGIALLESSEQLNNALDRRVAGGLSADAFAVEVNSWREQFNTNVAQLRAEFTMLPPPPRLSALVALQPSVEAILQRSEQGIDQVANFGLEMAVLMDQVAAGDIDQATAMHQRAARMVRELLMFENGSLAIMQAMSPADHPNRNIASSRIAFNDALIVTFDAFLHSVRAGQIVINDQQRRALREGAAMMRRQNAGGRTATQRIRMEASSYAQTMSEPMRAGIERMFASLGETFDTLDVAAVLLETAADTRNGGSVDDFLTVLARVEQIAEVMDRQNAERASALASVAAPEL
jgi:hypothetical protein